MAFTLDADTKERVRAATDIVDLISSYNLELRRQGRAYVALCPFHRDRRPSLQINPDRQTWKCWVCDVGGDVFGFVMQKEGLSFPETLRMLAERAGIAIEMPQGSKAGSAATALDEKQTLYRVMAWASRLYHQYLTKAAEAAAAREYLNSRGITEQSIQQFEIGLVPNSWSFLLDQVGAAGYNVKHLEATGLAKRGEKGHAYDLFRNRVMFPIRDTQNRVIAFGGRVLPGSEESAKYINSPESRIFTKHQHLYGLDKARDSIREHRQAIIMEGYTDVIVAHQCGLTSSVAVLGTALGASHLKILRHLCDKAILLLDGDEAGQRRSDQVLELFLNAQMDVRVLSLPEQMDPADYLLKHSAESLRDLAAAAPDALEFKMRRVCQGFDPIEDTHRATQALEQMLTLMSAVPRSNLINDDQFLMRRNQVLARLAKRFALPEDELRTRLRHLSEQNARRKRPDNEDDSGRVRFSGPSGSNSKSGTKAPSYPRQDHNENRAARANDRRDNRTTRYDEPNSYAHEDELEPVTVSASGRSTSIMRPGDLTPVERELLELLISSPSLASMILERVLPEWLQSSAAKEMLDVYHELEIEGEPLEYDHVLCTVEDPSIKSLLVTIYEEGQLKQKFVKDTPEQRLRVLTQRMGQQQEEQQRRRQLSKLEDGGLDDETELMLLTSFIQQARQSHGLDASQSTTASDSSPIESAPASEPE